MKKLMTVLGVIMLALAATTVCASPPELVNYQGILTDSGGVPVNETVPIVVRIYAQESGGTPTWEQSLGGVAVLNGLYSFQFGDSDLTQALESSELWLELVVDGETQTPRQPLASVPFALKAQSAETALHADSATDAFTLEGNGMAALVNPVGVVLPYAGGNTVPAGYLLCDGSEVSRRTYLNLFNTIGIAYGAGDGTTTFNLPDLRGRVAAGKDDMGGAAANRLTNAVAGATLGAVGGEQTHAITINEMPSHTHNVNYNSDNTPGGSYPTIAVLSGGPYIKTTTSAGGNAPHNNVQPTIILNYIIKY